MPKISVIIPTCNRPDLAPRAVKSVLSQTLKDLEAIVVDDGIEKRAEEAIKKINDERIVYIKHETNRGAAAARNTGIKAARAPYVAFLDDDDEYLPEKMEKQLSALEKIADEAAFVFSPVINYYEESGRSVVQPIKESGLNDFYELALAHRIRILTPSFLAKKEALDAIGGFDEKYPSNQEWDLTIRLTKKFKGFCLNEPLVKVHLHQGEHINTNSGRRIRGREMIISNHFQELEKRPKILAKHYFELAIICRDAGERKKAAGYFALAFRLDKTNLRYLFHLFCLLF